MNEKKLVIGYMRVSGDGQIDGDGFYRQKEAIEAFCRVHGADWEVEYAREEGISGALKAMERPMLAALFLTWEKEPEKRPYAVVVERLDRFARDLMVQECALRDFHKFGVKVFSAENGLIDMTDNTTDPARVVMRQIFGAIAQYDKAMLVAKLAHGRARRKASGLKPCGKLAYGEVDFKEREVVNSILSMADAGMRIGQIKRVLDYEKIVGRNGAPFGRQTIGNILNRYRPNRIIFRRTGMDSMGRMRGDA